MPVIDIVILVVVALSMWKGLTRGLVREAMALIGWLLGLLVAINGYEQVAPLLAGMIQTPSLQKAAAFLLLCLSMVALSYVIALVLHTMLKALALNPVDKIMGGAFGIARGLLIVLLAVGLLAPFVQNDPWWQQVELPRQLLPYVPVAQKLTDELKRQWQQHAAKTPVNFPVDPSGQDRAAGQAVDPSPTTSR